jgi:hypothetical protein
VEAQPSQKTKEANRNVESEPKQENLDLSSGAASGAHDTTSVKD